MSEVQEQVEEAYFISKQQRGRRGKVPKPMEIVNFVLLERVQGWVEFLSNFLRKPPKHGIYRQTVGDRVVIDIAANTELLDRKMDQ